MSAILIFRNRVLLRPDPQLVQRDQHPTQAQQVQLVGLGS